MFPPSGGYSLDIEAISGICGSISIACWVVVFSPQIIENFRRSSAEGLSIEFIIIWLAGDVFNILGAVLQGVLPTMIILAIYYTIADIVLLLQCFYYRGFTLRDPRPNKSTSDEETPTEQTALLNGDAQINGTTEPSQPLTAADAEPDSARNRSRSSFRERLASLDGVHMSPATPMHPQPKNTPDAEVFKPSQPRSLFQATLFNSTAIVLVVVAGVAGYYLSPSAPQQRDDTKTPAQSQADSLQFSLWGQIFGYICAVLYLGSRVPQLLLNYRRRSTEGLNALFFIFACIGNLTYVCSIFAFEPICSEHYHGRWHESHCKPGEVGAIYGKYILVNLSWLIGSLGTLVLDFAVFLQFFVYRNNGSAASARDAIPRTHEGDGRGREPNER
ncbi:PQ-loop-domain-containing protein [Polychaeton citri CBS 116435]|uniref:PQ-loop-domain-containing protein n=1 Tax=Polychaeton citri CBS 116435 TaxID=1314669 RepID=A0A9P4Q3Q4_9PEZI|nr:PQ-loop-domain-containing protein [Polychaeton citri CBS 116435]